MTDPLDSPAGLAQALGPLERRVLEEIWALGAATVRELVEGFPGVAYTTLMTTADRLFRKGLLVRDRDGRAFRYRPRWSRAELHLRLASTAMAKFLHDDERALRPLISLFVDEVSRRDHAMLDELERLVRRKKEGDR
ncbi:MAG TPA: BlaI/MecI/CopY family transcriptional regulator [Vicinamibacterales bacterium]|nr:BlaI/MecI/CopY family transcriptional regulator [Vicinamibacterales bacterium]